MKDEKLRRQDHPPKSGPLVEVIRVEAGPGVAVQLLASSIWGVWTHWDGRRSRKCIEPDSACEGHSAGWPRRWKGYIHCWCSMRKSCVFLECTPAMAEEIIRQQGNISSLRGLLLHAKRHGKSNKASVDVQLTASAGGQSGLPDEVSPEKTLKKLWGWVDHSGHEGSDAIE